MLSLRPSEEFSVFGVSMSSGKKFAIGFVVLAIVAGGIAAWFAARPTPVSMVDVETRPVSEVYVVTGRVRSRTTSGVGSELAGRVATVHVREGSRPERAAALVDLQPIDAKLAVRQAEANVEIARRELQRVRRGVTDAQKEQARADVAAAKADLSQARKELERTRALANEGVATAMELDRASTNLERTSARVKLAEARLAELTELPRPSDIRVAQARLSAAEANLDQTRATLGKTTIAAPFDGLVLEVNASVGENVQPGQAIVTLAKMDDLEFYAEVDESYFGRISTGQTATAVFSSRPDERFEAEVTQVGPDVDPDRGVVAVHLDPKSLPDGIVPGLSADVAIELARLESARSVPVRALARDGEQAYVFVIEDGVATRADVDVRAEGEEWVAVEGIEGVDRVVGDISLVDAGDRVRPEKP
jgi:multidrug resistance efflux pump